MAKTITDYLGNGAELSGAILTVDLSVLKAVVDPNDDGSRAALTEDMAIAILVAGLHKNALPQTDANGLAVVEPTTALVANESFQSKTFEVRGEAAQVRHEFIFSIYTADDTDFDPDKVV